MQSKMLIKDIIEWDVTNWSNALFYWDSVIDIKNKGYNCLELGARRGGLSLWLSLNGNKVICSDLTNPATTAIPLHNKYKIAVQNITYKAIDATNIPYEEYFDIIAFKSILGGIGKNGFSAQQKVINEIYNALKKGGVFIFAENLKGSTIHQFFRKRFNNWSTYWRYISIKELEKLLKKFSFYEYKTAGFLGTLGRNECQRNFLGILDKLFFQKILSNNNLYIVYGIAKK